ncbi:MAG: ABC transporter substrate-binding protein [bacterium]
MLILSVAGFSYAKNPVTISFWHIWGGVRTKQLETVLNDFMATHPDVKVETLLLPNPGYADKIITGLAGDAPDLTMIYTDEFAPSARRGALRRLDDLMAQDGISPDSWYAGQWAMAQWQSKAYGLPFVGNFLAMIYWNRDDFKKAGFDPEKGPETWDELIGIAKKLTTFKGDRSIDRLGYVPNGMGEWMHGTYRNGHDWFGDGSPKQIAVDHPRSLEALNFTVDLYNAMGGWDAVGATLEGWGNQQLGNPMIAGVASSILSGVFTVNIINQQKPDLNYKIGKVPHGPNGEFLDLTQAAWNNCIPTKAKHSKEAWELAKYLSLGEGHLKFMVELQARPAMVKKYNEPPYDALARKNNPHWDIVLEILKGKHVSFPVSDRLGAARNLLNEAFESVMLKKRTPAEGVSWAQKELVKIFQEEM